MCMAKFQFLPLYLLCLFGFFSMRVCRSLLHGHLALQVLASIIFISNASTVDSIRWISLQNTAPASPSFNLVNRAALAPEPAAGAGRLLERSIATVEFKFESMRVKPWEGERIHEVGADEEDLKLTWVWANDSSSKDVSDLIVLRWRSGVLRRRSDILRRLSPHFGNIPSAAPHLLMMIRQSGDPGVDNQDKQTRTGCS